MIVSKDKNIKKEILSKAQKLFQIYGLKKTTMDEIAEACGKSKSTLYHYFRSKEEVFDAVVELEMTSLRILVKNFVEEKKTTQEKLITYFIKYHEETMSMLNIYRIVKHELMNENWAREHFMRLMKFEQAYIQRILEDGYDANDFTEIGRDDIPWFSETMLAAFFGIVRYLIEKDEEFDREKLQKITGILIPKIFG